MLDSETLVERFARSTDSDGGFEACWPFNGLRHGGYGLIYVGQGHTRWAHRVAYEMLVGPIPAGLQIDHLCRNRACVNPNHLEPVAPKENTRRGTGHGKETRCPRGHAYDEANTYYGRTGRKCRECRRAWMLVYNRDPGRVAARKQLRRERWTP